MPVGVGNAPLVFEIRIDDTLARRFTLYAIAEDLLAGPEAWAIVIRVALPLVILHKSLRHASDASAKAGSDETKVKANDKAYNAALRNLPDKQFDPWRGVR